MKQKMENLGVILSRSAQKQISGGSDCSATCPAGQSASITNCNGTCTGSNGYATCVGPNNTLTKTCKREQV